MNRSTWRTRIAVGVGVLLLGTIWQIAAGVLDTPVILPGPIAVAQAVLSLVGSPQFITNIAATIQRAVHSFLVVFLAGLALGLCAGQWPILHACIKPMLSVVKTVPVMSVILLAFIWFSSGTVPVFSAFLMAFPIMFIQVEQAVGAVPAELDEMTKLYGFSKRARLMHLVVPSMAPSIIIGAKASLSMVWKVVVAAEVLTVPRYGVGSRLQRSQINLETAQVLAWTVVAVLLATAGDVLFDGVISWVLPEGRIRRHSPKGSMQ